MHRSSAANGSMMDGVGSMGLNAIAMGIIRADRKTKLKPNQGESRLRDEPSAYESFRRDGMGCFSSIKNFERRIEVLV